MTRLKEKLDRSEPIRISAANLIQATILQGEVLPGEEIPQLPLAKRLGLSQSSVREALQELEYSGIIQKSDRSWKVTQLSTDEMADLYEIRALLEPHACSLAATHWNDAAAIELEDCLRRMVKAAQSSDYREHWSADIAFHHTIWRVQPNRALERQLQMVCMPIFAHGLLNHTTIHESSYRRSIQWHRLIWELLRTRDSVRVGRVVHRIVRRFHRLNLEDFALPHRQESNLIDQ